MKLVKVFPIIAMLLIVFITGCNKEDEFTGVSPEVTSTNPIREAVSIATGTNISALFSADMDPLTMTAVNFIVTQGTSVVPGVISYEDSTVLFTPSTVLSANTLYNVKISTGVKNNSGMRLLQDYTWSFTTGAIPDLTMPSVNSTDPLNNATGIAADKAVKFTFSEAMDASTINASTLTLTHGVTPVAGTIAYSDMTATFTPTNSLIANTTYTATITTAVKDVAGNALAANAELVFTTVEAPMVNTTDPLNLAVGVSHYKVIKATFSVPMDQSTISLATFTVKQGINPVVGVVTYTGSTASFNPSYNFLPGTVYTATVTTGAKNVAGFALENDYEWSFTTETTTLAMGAVDLGAAANYVILAKTGISNISTSAITGNLGLSPAATSYITGLSLTDATGYATSAQVTGKIYAADMAAPTGINLTTAVENMITAYNDAAGRPTPDFLELGTGNLGGMTLTPGLYKFTTTVTLPSDVTISGGENDVWIFQISQNLVMSGGVHLILEGGAQAKNIFWQVAGDASFGTTSHFEGIILSMTGITFQTGASFKGRALAQTAVVLDGNAVILP